MFGYGFLVGVVFDYGVVEGVELVGGEYFDVMLCVLLIVVVR